MHSRDDVTRGRSDGVTSDVSGHLAPELPVWELDLGIKNLAPAQDVDLPLPYPQLEHLVGEDRGLDDGDPRSDLLVRYRRQEYRSHIKRVSDASERLLANSPYGEKAHRKKTAEKPRLI